ncbi:carboxypeptidase-like regulatory domain-containing protein [Aquimarina sp. 2201CG5-10]|uniref:carboxypeptidase-like regulatory domain-containing protein n=1 Tax=Aquimarina callyspongiae TaxID=3098150 RepID=UPI002AB56CEB|nr:carboxypeptidase-like regulatory domain-containing protein [Aquimarina sp. 2201CG5-10]MDY8135137.1 TonB-dependent receptor [Aquimarina sp. 2201CG5-10]
MKQHKLTLTIFLLFTILSFGQGTQITGTVTAASDGVPLPGVNIIVKGTANGAQTDFDGKYTITASQGDVLQISYLGMKTKEVIVGTQTTIDVQLDEDLEQLEDVVVTALGIKKSRKTLTYAAQDIKAEDITRVKDANPINNLSGRISGVSINRSSSGVGGSVKVTLRGNTSTRNNQPLYVIDGIPLSNPSPTQPNSTFGDINGGNRDGGDALALLNPDNIESITVLKGASASALYGSQGSNGVILITTKKGKEGAFKVDFSSNVTIDQAAYLLDFNSETESNVDDFFQTGITNINSLSVSGGTEKAQSYFSYSNTFADGVMPTNTVKKHTVNFRETAKLFDNRLSIDGSVLLSTQSVVNRPISGLYFNPLTGVYNFASPGERLSEYENFEELDPNRNIQSQRWWRGTFDTEQNPYWILNRNKSEDRNQKLVAALALQFKVNDWLSLQTRGSYDRSTYLFERDIFATTEATLAPLNGRYILNEADALQLYGDLIATVNTNFNEDLSFTANLGSSINRTTSDAFTADSGTTGGLQFANIFSVQNFVANPGVSFNQTSSTKEVQSLFASAQLGYKDMVFLDVTGRNDWSSALPSSNNSFFYPSFGVTGLLSEIFDLGEHVSLGKIRASYAEVGNDIPANLANPTNQILFGNGLSPAEPVLPLGELKPETQKSIELGTEWRFLQGRLGFDFSYYKTNTEDQFMIISVATSTGSAQRSINAGDIENKGFEVGLFAKPVKTDDFSWETNLNFALNDNTVKELPDELPNGLFTLTGQGVNSYALYIREGGSFGDIYARVIQRDASGRPVVDEDAGSGALVPVESNNPDAFNGLEFVGNANPDWTLGWSNTFSYKNWNATFLIDGKFGGEVMSLTEAIVEGGSSNTERTSGTGTIEVVNSTGTARSIPEADYYRAIGGRNGFTGEYVYSATNIRLAEMAIGYDFKLGESSFFNSARASLIGRNLFFFYKDAPYDPNISLSTANGLQGIDAFGAPSTRSYGLNIQLTF